jgi:hypothetical protein
LNRFLFGTAGLRITATGQSQFGYVLEKTTLLARKDYEVRVNRRVNIIAILLFIYLAALLFGFHMLVGQ